MTVIYALFLCSVMQTWDGTAWVRQPMCNPVNNEIFAAKSDCDQRRLFFIKAGAEENGRKWVCMELDAPAWRPAQ